MKIKKNKLKCIKNHYSYDMDGNKILVFRKGKSYKYNFTIDDITNEPRRVILSEVSDENDIDSWWLLSTEKCKIYFKW